MTAQMPDKLINELPGLDLAGLSLYGVVRGVDEGGRWGEPYRFQNPPLALLPDFACTALYRGYVATFRIGPDGRVTLVRYEYPYRRDLPPEARDVALSEELTGDFWLVLGSRDLRAFVPAVDGVVVADRARWRTVSLGGDGLD